MVLIYSYKTFLKATGLISLVCLFAVSITAIRYFRHLNLGFLWVSGAVFLIAYTAMFCLYLAGGRGRKIEITEDGINIGKSYLGPYKTTADISAYTLPKYHNSEMLIGWKQINKITLGTWERIWARHWNILTPLLAGEKMSTPEKAALTLGIPAKRLKGYYLTIETKKAELYAIEMNAGMSYKAEQAIRDLGDGSSLESDGYQL